MGRKARSESPAVQRIVIPVSTDEYETIKSLAGDVPLGTWTRKILFRAIRSEHGVQLGDVVPVAKKAAKKKVVE